jgi:transcriptional regulator with XRE-family HTH domain
MARPRSARRVEQSSRAPQASVRSLPLPPGDELGAAEVARRVGGNLRRHRKSRDMSLDDLAVASGVSRAALSHIETSQGNPTVGVLWKIAVGLGIPFSDLLGETREDIGVLRRNESQVLRSADGKMESRPLTPAGAAPWAELYELRLAARAVHASDAHAPGTREILVVLSGQVRLRIGDVSHDLAPGDSVSFAADKPHVYENPGTTESRYHDLILYER